LRYIKDLFSNWKEKIFIVKPETVIKRHKTAFKFYWRWKTKSKVGRQKTDREMDFSVNKEFAFRS
jgi:hypothetical protein